jgi:hypothetical protein
VNIHVPTAYERTQNNTLKLLPSHSQLPPHPQDTIVILDLVFLVLFAVKRRKN